MGSLVPLAELMKAFDHILVGKWMDMATTVIVVYEWLITLDMEVQYVWSSRWNLTKVMYLLNRYLVIADFIINYLRSHGVHVPACKSLFRANAAVYTFAVYMAECNLVLRVCVVWGMNKIIIAGLATVYSASFIYILVSFYQMVRPIVFFTLLPFGGCLAKIESSTFWIDYALLMGYDAVMLGLMAYPTFKGYRSNYKQTGLVKHIQVEGVLFYVYLLIIDVVSVMVQWVVRDDIFLFVLGTRMLRSILAARVILHLREHSDRKVMVSMIYASDSAMVQSELSEMRFV